MKFMSKNSQRDLDSMTIVKGTKGALISKNVRINGRRTSVRLEEEMWDALLFVAQEKNISIHSLCSEVSALSHERSSFSSALRVYLLNYFRYVPQGSGTPPVTGVLRS